MAMQIHSRKLKASLAALAALAIATPAFADTITGLWRGEYTCGQGLTAMTLAVNQNPRGGVRAVMTFYEHPKNPGVPTGCFTMAGRYDAKSGSLLLKQGRWLKQPDPFWYMIDFSGTVAKDGAHYGGKIVANDDGLCTSFTVTRVSRAAPPPEMKDCYGAALVS